MAEDRGPELGLVGADALEDAGAVVEAVAEYVDLGVVPCDELTVHPDRLGLPHFALLARFSEGRLWRMTDAPVAASERGDHGFGHLRGADPALAAGAGEEVRGPQPVAERGLDGGLDPIGVGAPVEAVAEHHRHREEGRERVRDALAGDVGRRAVDRLEEPGPPSPRLADGSIPSEPVIIAASSLRMSPNMFSVTITSNCDGSETSCIAALSTSRWSSSTSGQSRRPCR